MNNVKDRVLARSLFGEALQLTHQAINDPEESVKDETLLAVLLLGLYEVRKSLSASLSADFYRVCSSSMEITEH